MRFDEKPNDFSYVDIRDDGISISFPPRVDYIWRSIDECSCRRFAVVRINVFSSARSDRPATQIRLAKPPRGIPFNFWSPDAVSLLPRGEQIFWGSSDLPVLAKTSGMYIHAASYEYLVWRRMCTLTCWNFASTTLGCNFFTIVCGSSFVYVTILRL